MRVGNLQTAGGQIAEALDELQITWQSVRESWADQQAVYFEETYLKRIHEEITAIYPAIGQMSQIIGEAQRDCTE